MQTMVNALGASADAPPLMSETVTLLGAEP